MIPSQHFTTVNKDIYYSVVMLSRAFDDSFLLVVPTRR